MILKKKRLYFYYVLIYQFCFVKKYNNKKIKWDKIYKKKIDYLEKTIWEKWQTLESKEKSHFVEINASFIKFFEITDILNLTKWELKVILLILNNLSYWNDVFLSDLKRFKIFKNNNIKMIFNYIYELIKKDILYKTDIKWLYKLNPKIAFRWDAKSFKKMLWVDNWLWKNYKY